MKIKEFIEGLKEGQKLFGETIASIINSILLTIVYIIGVGLTYIVAKIFRKKFLNLKFNKTESYWEDLDLGKKPKETYYRQF